MSSNFVFRAFGVALAVLCSTHHSLAAINNGGFETGNLSAWSSMGSVSASTGNSYGGAGTVLPDTGKYAARLISSGQSASALAAQMGITEATLEASNAGVNATNGALLYQTTVANAGDTFSFRWNFVEQDYLPYDDWAFYGISKNGGPAAITKFASLGSVGPGAGTTINGWTTLNVTVADAGTYTFYFGTVNAIDQSLDSDLWIDGVGVAGAAVPEPASLAIWSLASIGCAVAGFRRRTMKA